MMGYIVNPRGGFLSIGPSSPRMGCTIKLWRVGLSVGPSDPWIRQWIMVKPERLRGTQIHHGVGGEI